jgi:hypothetical protein
MKIIMKFQRGTPRLDLEKLYAQRQKVHDCLEENFDAIECEIGNVEMQWMWKECVQDNMSDLIGNVDRMNESRGLHRK